MTKFDRQDQRLKRRVQRSIRTRAPQRLTRKTNRGFLLAEVFGKLTFLRCEDTTETTDLPVDRKQ